MSNSTINTSVSGNNVTIKVVIGAGETLDWWVRVTSKNDYGYGLGQGVGDYPWIVDIISGNTTTYNVTKTYRPGIYAAELNIAGVGSVDVSTFGLGSGKITFKVIGNGQMYVERNRSSVGLATPGNAISGITYTTGDTLGIVLTPYLGSTLIGLCDFPQTDCETALSYYLDILDGSGLPQMMIATFTAAPVVVPPPVVVKPANYALIINLSPLSWANLGGLTSYLPGITTAFAEAITLYGWLGWDVIESKIESGNLVIYMRDNNVTSSSVDSIGNDSRYILSNGRIMKLALPELAEITAALVTITAIALRFGYLIIGYSVVNLLTKAVDVAKTQADTEQVRTQTVSDMCKSGALTPAQCAEALKPPAEKGICESFGFSSTACSQLKTGGLVVGGLIVAYALFNVAKAIKVAKPTKNIAYGTPG
jgi:hypothetical protein